MAAKKLPRGMGKFFKDCEHTPSRWTKCPHLYKIRYRSASGRQVEESGFETQDLAIDRLTSVYKAKKAAPRKQAKSERIEKYGNMRFRECTAEWKAGQRHLAAASISHLDSLLQHHLFPALGSRRMGTFDHKGTDHQWQFDRPRAAAATSSGRVAIRTNGRLGPYASANVVVVQPPSEGRRKGGRATWIGWALDDDCTNEITEWAAAGGPGVAEPPPALALRFVPAPGTTARQASAGARR